MMSGILSAIVASTLLCAASAQVGFVCDTDVNSAEQCEAKRWQCSMDADCELAPAFRAAGEWLCAAYVEVDFDALFCEVAALSAALVHSQLSRGLVGFWIRGNL
jgi:hypothetical protein